MTIYSLNYQFDDWSFFLSKFIYLIIAFVINIKFILYIIEYLDLLESFLTISTQYFIFLLIKSQNL